jgi:hypothetical protein
MALMHTARPAITANAESPELLQQFFSLHIRDNRIYPRSSIIACQSGGTTVVESIASMIAGPTMQVPGMSPPRQCTDVDV